MEPARRRGDREGVGGGSRMLRLYAHLIRAGTAVRMNEIKLKLNDAGSGGTVCLLFGLSSELLVSYCR